jgi:hypothetical protein
VSRRNFSHALAAEAKKFLEKLFAAREIKGGSASPEDDAKPVTEGANYQAAKPQSFWQRVEESPRRPFHLAQAKPRVEAPEWDETAAAG